MSLYAIVEGERKLWCVAVCHEQFYVFFVTVDDIVSNDLGRGGVAASWESCQEGALAWCMWRGVNNCFA